MTPINNAYVSALLADSSYVHNISGLTSNELITALTPRMTPALAEFIGNNFTVVTQTPEYTSGFSATVWVGKGDYAGQVYVSMRGTEPGFVDFQADADLATSGIAHRQLEDMINWWLRETTRETTPTTGMAKQIDFTQIVGEYGLEGYELEEGTEVQRTGNLSSIAGSITAVNGHSLGGRWPLAQSPIF